MITWLMPVTCNSGAAVDLVVSAWLTGEWLEPLEGEARAIEGVRG